MPMRRRVSVFIFALFFQSTVAFAADAARPRIGLVLGGGGARGAAHIGVLEVLQKLRVPIDCVAGTSMGALVAGAWAAGMSPEKMREALAAADWSDMFVDNPEYAEMSYRNKLVSRSYLPGSESGVSANGVAYQGGVVAGQKIKLFFNQLVRANQGERNIEDLPLPLSIVATDIGTGERVVFRDGALTTAMRASMSVPGLLAPVDHQGRKLVDGGLVDNLPIGEVRERCRADVVIAVNVGSPLLKAEEVGSLLTVSAQMVGILTEQNVSRSLATLRPGDIYIQPELNGITAADFSKHAEAAASGRAATQAAAPKLARLAASEPAYAAWWQGIEVSRRTSPRIDDIEIVGLNRVSPQAIERHLSVQPGETIRPSVIGRDLLRMYGDGYYESVDYTVLSQRDRNVLRIMPVEKRWGPDYARFSINLQADNSQGSTFGLRAAYHQTWLNPLGGELIYHGEIGTANRLGINYYQPLDARQRFFFEGTAGAGQTRLNIYEGDKRIAQYRDSETGVGAHLGVNVGLLGPLRLGWVHRHRYFDRDIGDPSLPRADKRFSGWKASLDFDQFDRMYFPTRGWAAQLSWFESPGQNYARAEADLRGAYAFGGTVVNARLRYTGSPRGDLPIYDAGTLGGFLNLTAFASNQIIGDDIRYLGLRGEQIIGRLPLGLRGDMRVGIALEAAKVGSPYTESQRRGVLDSTALYVGGETPFGPAYIGLGYSTSGASNLFLFVGTP
ncbi:MAG: patatin-like phospholipase family protein [Gammaproteobacteria bacterium]|nr:patatin-like phospholipase family protein [Gammaproteobacteria bacterium]MBU1600927.1 patatin-like phospholipase family protein [Gammaproteobacteria bacterium]MBU2434286.1 patatin-like phospholipase family protein [Gammaproteobacteria bacterium]MBU2449707.1 patatin-like phospholipase family protein [Gammaproteobacteria bacterium]